MENELWFQEQSPEDVALRRRKGKMVIIDEYEPIGLHVKILSAEEIDDLTLYPYLLFRRRFYYVAVWVEPDYQFRTTIVQGSSKPTWKQDCFISFGNKADDYGFLNLEVMRLGSLSDQGTSTGRALVGRARIPVPKVFNREVAQKFELVRLEGDGRKPEGKISLSMKLNNSLTLPDDDERDHPPKSDCNLARKRCAPCGGSYFCN